MTIYYTHKYKELKCKSHDLLVAAISDYIGNANRAQELVANIRKDNSHEYEGKPYIEGFEKFSISHSDSSWAVLIDKRECGLDIQYERSCDFLGIARRFFDPEDAAMIDGIYQAGVKTYEDARSDFFDIWTKREAFIKAIGSSVVFDECPPVAIHNSAEHNDILYYISSIGMPGAESLHAAICIDASEDIDEELVYKEMYVRT